MAINQEKKSNRLLGSRRFTSADLNTSQEAFQSNIDIQASEVYTQANLIPTSSLPFSGSSQNGSIHQVDSNNVLKYYYRQRLTPSNVARDVFFFMFPKGSDSGVTPQLIQDGQQTSFISPKYSLSSLANSNTEDSTPGYGIKVFSSTSTDSGSLGDSDIVSANDYQFDYKTGVLQFESALASNVYVYMTAYQYVGENLESGGTGTTVTANPGSSGGGALSTITIGDTSFSVGASGGGSGIFAKTGSFQATTNNLEITGSVALDTQAFKYGVTTWKEASGVNEFSGSSWSFKADKGSGDLFDFRDNNDNLVFKATHDKMLVFGAVTGTTPTPVAGGLIYSGSDEWFLGYENDPT